MKRVFSVVAIAIFSLTSCGGDSDPLSVCFENEGESFFDCRGADLEGADLKGVNLKRANFNGVNLARANLSGADLRQADLSRANLAEANLTGANLTGANLKYAVFTYAKFNGANLTDATVSGAIGIDKATFTGAEGFRTVSRRTEKSTVPTAEVTVTTVAKIDWKKCKSDLKNVQANMSTTDDALFDRLFQRAMRSCENEQTFRQYAPTQGIANMIEAGCALYPTQKLCQ